MSRVKRGKMHLKRRKNLLKRVKGFEGGRKKLIKLARTADLKAGSYAYADRRKKKRTMRRLWQVRINAATREAGMSYSVFIGKLKANNGNLDRKVLSEIAIKYPKTFATIVGSLK